MCGLAAWASGSTSHWLACWAFGFDKSANAAADADRLSKADRLGLGLSDFNAVPFGLAAFQRVASIDLLAELSGEVLVGADAPDVLHSPLRAALGGRMPILPTLMAELLMELSLSQRSEYARIAPLIPQEPRFTIGLGVRYAPDFGAPNPPAPAPIVVPESTRLSGEISDPDGVRLAGVHVTVRVAGHEYSVSSAEDGSFALDDLPRGTAQIGIEGAGLLPSTQPVALDRREVVLPLRVARSR